MNTYQDDNSYGKDKMKVNEDERNRDYWCFSSVLEPTQPRCPRTRNRCCHICHKCILLLFLITGYGE